MFHEKALAWCGESAIKMTVADRPTESTTDRITACARRIRKAFPSGALADVVPAYTTVTVVFDPAKITATQAWDTLSGLQIPDRDETIPAQTFTLPVCFCPRCAPDRDFAVSHSGLPWEEFVRRYTSAAYRIACLGFQPAFPFMLLNDPQLALPRLEEPRLSVPAGSVGIGGSQTGFYPRSTPGGWRIIGRTRETFFDPASGQLPPYARGDWIRFTPLEAHEAVEPR